MQTPFDILIDSFIETEVGVSENFISETLSEHLAGNLNALYKASQMKPAGTGNAEQSLQNKLFRSDIIYWLDRSHNNIFENEFLDLIDNFVIDLNRTCYAGITGYEFHYALYEPGSFYKRHRDQFRNDESRQYSMIVYLNKLWSPADGGELCIYREGEPQQISPENRKAVFFKSAVMEHEVLVTHAPRMSITGWLKI